MGLEGWGSFFGKLSTFVPGRVEQMKNEKKRLLDERKKIMDNRATVAGITRVNAIDLRVSSINSILGNKASD